VSEESESPEHDDVRRLLADARHAEPMPADVADRMDAVLAGLSPESAPESARGSAHTAEVVPLDAQRRRRAAGLLVAAAVIVVGGVVAAQQLSHGSSAQQTAGGADRAPSAAGGGGNDAATAVPPKTNSQSLHERGTALGPLRTRDGRMVVRSRHFSADALAGRLVLAGHVPAATDSAQHLKLAYVSARCVRPPAGSEVVRAMYERAPAALVYHAPAGSTQVVDLYVCGTSQPVRSVTLPTP
jgi:hypothetical protein